ncbi:hypothetical protein LG840_003268 [Citrobacter freundii]|nr:hypothetical protein [Citrobacter freundii]
MITFTKEQLIASAHARIEFAEMMLAGELEPLKERTWSIELELARIALASLEAEPVGFIHPFTPFTFGKSSGAIFKEETRHYYKPVYASQPAQVVPDDLLSMAASAIEDLMEHTDPSTSYYYCVWADVPGKLRAAMLQAGNSPVTPDDVHRMDWLVSKTVDVREPMVYGSHSLFWSQTITDEEDDYHATKLREQIDAAMEAEKAAAPHQEVK